MPWVCDTALGGRGGPLLASGTSSEREWPAALLGRRTIFTLAVLYREFTAQKTVFSGKEEYEFIFQ